MKPIICVIIDDEPIAIEVLVEYAERIDSLEMAGAFRSPLKALEFLKQNRVDLIFLDINMPGLTGIQFLESLDHIPLIVFTTAYSEYAVRSYDYQAVDYLLKPIEFERFLKAVRRAHARCDVMSGKTEGGLPRSSQSLETILVKSGNQLHQIVTDDIMYVKGSGNYVTFVTGKKEIMVLMKMRDVLAELPQDRFFRVHRSYIVALRHIEVIEKDRLKMNQATIPIGGSFRGEFVKRVKELF